MANVYDVAKYILEQQGVITAMKLQKLVYYSQAWSLVWDDQELFSEEFQAWANGPVSPDLYGLHRGQYQITDLEKGNSDNLNKTEKETIDIVLGTYGDKPSQWLSDRTHSEDPWIEARRASSAEEGERSQQTITKASMAEYYSSF